MFNAVTGVQAEDSGLKAGDLVMVCDTHTQSVICFVRENELSDLLSSFRAGPSYERYAFFDKRPAEGSRYRILWDAAFAKKEKVLSERFGIYKQ